MLRPELEAERDVIRRWANGFVDRDGKFVKEFQTTFNSSFWELYLHAALRELGLNIDFSHARPDFVVDGAVGALALEAVVTLNPQDLSPDWAKHNPASEIGVGRDRERFLDLATLRLAQSVQAKSDKWLKSYSKIPTCADRSFVICVAPFEQPQAQRQGTQAIERVLFGEPQELILKDDSEEIRVGGVNLQEAFKPSGSRVELGLFRDSRLSHVSGVLFSALATWSKVSALAIDDGRPLFFQLVRQRTSGVLEPHTVRKRDHREGLLEGLHLFLNPFANRALDTKPWADAGVGIHRLVGPELARYSEAPDGVLVARACGGFSFAEDPVHPAGAPRATDFPSHQVAKPRDGEWFGGPADFGLSKDAFLMLHAGWTICVGRDVQDDDWGYMAKRGTHLSMQHFIDAGDNGPKHFAIAVSIATRDGALEAARTWIETKGRIWRSSSRKRKHSK